MTFREGLSVILAVMETEHSRTASERVGANVRRLRERRRWTLADLSEATASAGPDSRIDEATLSRLENQATTDRRGRPVRAEELELFAAIFSVTVAELLADPTDARRTRFSSAWSRWVQAVFDADEAVVRREQIRQELREIAGDDQTLRLTLLAMDREGYVAGPFVDPDSELGRRIVRDVVNAKNPKKATKKGGR